LKKIGLISFLLIQLFVSSQTSEKSLNSCQWAFKKTIDNKWLKATVPGTVHTDLFANKIIPDPFYADNEKQLQWIEKNDWEYQCSFNISKQEFAQEHIELQFKGLDTYASVFLNDSLLLKTDNMFRSWNIDIKTVVKTGKNHLKIVFQSAVNKGKEEAKKLTYTLPGDEKVFTRKAQYQYGWDWGPRFVTSGIWKDIQLKFWNDARIKTVQNKIIELNDSIALINFVCEIESDTNANTYIDITRAASTDLKDQRTIKLPLKKGIHKYEFEYIIKNPNKWWPNGMGQQFMYNIFLSLSFNRKILDIYHSQLGLRTVELVNEKDSIGTSFYFKVNGKPLFIKGANYIPQDNFITRIKKENYITIIQNAVDANMNMLRVWGGGIYENDDFYTQCDLNGILVWQDFMFACAMYPGEKQFMNNVAAEATEQVERLRNHPSIALWCGNNEVDEGWQNWGWQKQYNYSETDSSEIAMNNTIIFDYLLKDIVNIHDGSRAYWASSPSIGWGHKESLLNGDSHYWGVWWGMEPFENYKTKTGRFVSEYGFQGMPNLNTLIKVGLFKVEDQKNTEYKKQDTTNQPLPFVGSKTLETHQKHPTGYQTIATYMERDYNVPHYRLEHFAYVSQLLQAEGMKTAIEAHRRAKPYCMGTLYWQLNDCWPVTSWSTIDYYNIFKASHYQVKRSYKDLIVSIDEQKDSCSIYVISDLQQTAKAELIITLNDLTGKVLYSNTIAIELKANSSQSYYSFNKELLKAQNIKNCFLKAELNVLDGTIYNENAIHYFVKPKELALTKGNVEIIENSYGKCQCFSIKSDVLLKNVMISIEGETFNLSDNYFDVLPNESKTIYLPKHFRTKNLKKKIKLVSLVDTY
jgi:beta-mannosidase